MSAKSSGWCAARFAELVRVLETAYGVGTLSSGISGHSGWTNQRLVQLSKAYCLPSTEA